MAIAQGGAKLGPKVVYACQYVGQVRLSVSVLPFSKDLAGLSKHVIIGDNLLEVPTDVVELLLGGLFNEDRKISRCTIRETRI